MDEAPARGAAAPRDVLGVGLGGRTISAPASGRSWLDLAPQHGPRL